MTVRIPDPRLWAPVVVALVVLVARELRRQPAPAPIEAGRAVAMPLPRSTAAPRRELEYDLWLPATTIRFHDERDGQSRLYECRIAEGHLVLSPELDASRIDLRLDLESLRPLVDEDPEAGERTPPLGLEKHAEFSFRAKLVSAASTPVPCLTHTLWQGTLRFGSHSVRKEIGLWQTAYPGQPLRLQGHGTVAGDTFGLPRRGLFGFLHHKHAISLGLGLAWKRAPRR